jgi:PAS domain S-box-containing protein
MTKVAYAAKLTSMDNLLKALKTCGEQFKDTSFTIVDMHKDDSPLVYVNSHFSNMTGFPHEEIINKNCRFLQAGKSDQLVLKSLRSSLKKGIASYHDLVNFKKDGAPFWNRPCLFPIHHEIAGLKYFVGIQMDITQHKEGYESHSVKDFVENDGISQDIHDQIENPLEQLLQNSRALKYFADNDPESLQQRQKIAHDISQQVKTLTQYVASLKV